MEYILDWNGVNGKILSKDYIFTIDTKPKLSFDYLSLYYETESGLKIYRILGDRNDYTLNDEQIKECKDYCDKFIDVMDYPVLAYRPEDYVYVGQMLKSAAVSNGYKYIISENIPTDPFCKIVDGYFLPVYCAFDESGKPYYNPVNDSSKFVKVLSKDEYDKLPERKNLISYFNFVTEQWEDKRDHERTKFNAKLEIRGYYEHDFIRTEGRVPSFEMGTWETQYREAENWLKDNSYPTPFIDAMLPEIKSIKIDKQTLCEKILNHYTEDQFKKAGKYHGEMYDYIYRVEKAETNEEIDEIVTEVYNKIGRGVVINTYSKFPPMTQTDKDNRSVVLNGDTIYHGGNL